MLEADLKVPELDVAKNFIDNDPDECAIDGFHKRVDKDDWNSTQHGSWIRENVRSRSHKLIFVGEVRNFSRQTIFEEKVRMFAATLAFWTSPWP